MAKAILLCGKICSGKSTYAVKLKNEVNAVILSCDELMLALFDQKLGDKHNEILAKTKSYLYGLAEQILNSGVNVILDFGFWFKEERTNVKQMFNVKNIQTEMHYVKVSTETWLKQIDKRNDLIKHGLENSYFVDENMKDLFGTIFKEPSNDECDVVIINF